MAELGHVDAIVFTAGVGERGPITRGKSLSGLENYGIKIDAQKNEWSFTGNAETCISADDSKTKIFVIPTDEELVMTEDAPVTIAIFILFPFPFMHISNRFLFSLYG